MSTTTEYWRPGLPGRRLSARRRRPYQTTAFCRHSNTRDSLSVGLRRTVVLETVRFPPQDHKSGTVCRPISNKICSVLFRLCGLSYGQFRRLVPVTDDIFIRTVRPRHSANCFQLRRIEIFLLTYLVLYYISLVIKCYNKCVSRTDTNPPFAFQTAFPRGTDFSVSTGRVKKLHTLLVSLYF